MICYESIRLTIFALLAGLTAVACVDVKFSPSKIKMIMGSVGHIDYTVIVNQTALTNAHPILKVQFKPITLSPQFDIIEFAETNSTEPESILLTLDKLRANDFVYNSSLNVRATYIGHATFELKAFVLKSDTKETNESIPIYTNRDQPLELTVIRNEGLLDKIFMYSVIFFITISYINLGAQIDTENVARLIEAPRIIFLGLLIGFTVMPLASWVAGHIFFQDQPMYRIGSFIYACGPAASASVLWTVMFDADKELALGLQIASTICALFTMPIMLYAMDVSIGHYTVKTPYINLARTLIVLLVALAIGSRLVGYSKRAKEISQKIFRPLTMSVLMFIVIFSSVVYYFIYRMFDWNITKMALLVTSATYLTSGLLGYLIHRDLNHMITISISSTYRNSGIAFAALLVAFQPPDIFIAYVPCLTQVVITSLIGLVLYSIKEIKNRL